MSNEKVKIDNIKSESDVQKETDEATDDSDNDDGETE